MVRVGILGLGSVGLRAANILSERGFDVIALDARGEAVEKARELGIDARLFDVEGGQLPDWLEERRIVVALVALPHHVAEKVVARLMDRGIPMVVVTVKPLTINTSTSRPSPAIVEAGLSPGLSNLVVFRTAREVGRTSVRVLVGSFGKQDDGVLGHASTWSTRDMLEQYVSPSVIVKDGRVLEVDPLDEQFWIEFLDQSFGKLVCFPSQGLSGFMDRHGGMFRYLAECSVRRPAHLNTVKTLQYLGLLDKSTIRVAGCIVRPIDLMSELISRRYPAVLGDNALLIVETLEGQDWRRVFRLTAVSDVWWSATSKAVGGASAAFTEVFISESIFESEEGVIYPEDLYEMGLYEKLVSLLTSHGVAIEEG